MKSSSSHYIFAFMLFAMVFTLAPQPLFARTSPIVSVTHTTQTPPVIEPENGSFVSGPIPFPNLIANEEFSQTSQAEPVSSYPANYDFEAGLTDWTPSDAGAVQVLQDSNSLSGAYLLIRVHNQSVTSSAFTVPTETQSLLFDYMSWAQNDARTPVQLFVEVLSGTDFATSTLLGTPSGTQIEGWKTAVLDLQAFQGQTIKVRIRNDEWWGWQRQSRTRLDSVRLQTEVPGWKPTNAAFTKIVEDSSSIAGPYLLITGANQAVTSSAFTLPPNSQSLRFSYMTWAQRHALEQSRLYVEVLSGAEFATTTVIGTQMGSQVEGWKTAVLDLQAFQGQTIKLRLRNDDAWERQPQARVDTLTIQGSDLRWFLSDANRVAIVPAPITLTSPNTTPLNAHFNEAAQAAPSISYPLNANFGNVRQPLSITSYPANYAFSMGMLSTWTATNASLVQVVQDSNSIDVHICCLMLPSKRPPSRFSQFLTIHKACALII